MPKVIPGRVTWLSPLPRGRRTTPNYSRRARMLLIKQINDLDFFTVRPTLPLPPLPGCQFFMSFRGPKAHHNRMAEVGSWLPGRGPLLRRFTVD